MALFSGLKNFLGKAADVVYSNYRQAQQVAPSQYQSKTLPKGAPGPALPSAPALKPAPFYPTPTGTLTPEQRALQGTVPTGPTYKAQPLSLQQQQKAISDTKTRSIFSPVKSAIGTAADVLYRE